MLEQFSLEWEKGDTAVPFALRGGDFYGYFTRRSLQLALKGVQLELQPGASPDRRHSLLLFAGEPAPTYNDLQEQDNLYAGASWLVSDAGRGQLSLNLVHNRDSTRSNSDGSAREQDIASIAGNTGFAHGDQRYELEGELAGFQGDGAGVEDGRAGAVFARFSGHSLAIRRTPAPSASAWSVRSTSAVAAC